MEAKSEKIVQIEPRSGEAQAEAEIHAKIQTWYQEAVQQTPKSIGAWMRGILDERLEGPLQVHAHVVIGLGALKMAQEHDAVGLPPEVQHEIVQRLTANLWGIKGPWRLQIYDDLLDPAKAALYAAIPEPIHERLQAQARKQMLAAPPQTPPQVLAHLKRVGDGWLPDGVQVLKVGGSPN